jgi:hypothetical protein
VNDIAPSMLPATSRGTLATACAPTAANIPASSGNRAASVSSPSPETHSASPVRSDCAAGPGSVIGKVACAAATSAGNPVCRTIVTSSVPGRRSTNSPVIAPVAATAWATTTSATSSTLRAPASAAVSAWSRVARATARSAVSRAARSAAAASRWAVMSSKTATAVAIRSSSRIGVADTRIVPVVPSPRRKSISSPSTVSPSRAARASGHSAGA